jgi:type IV secretion system protein VirB2
MALPSFHKAIAQTKNPLLTVTLMFLAVAFVMMPELVLAQTPNTAETQGKVCGFFSGISSILNAASVVVVTVAVLFSGYQIAFAHKRIAEVTPPLLGGVLIGAAAQIAKMVVGKNDECGTTSGASPTGLLLDAVHAATQLIHFHA